MIIESLSFLKYQYVDYYSYACSLETSIWEVTGPLRLASK